jgi:homotetrameric cytidine deaminase
MTATEHTIAGRPPSAAEHRLWQRARAAAAQAYAPYSGLCVGAALVTAAGNTFTGVNVENASYPVGLCAERAALAAAVTAGERHFAALAVATDQGASILPCGACLQALAEFGELDLVVTLPATSSADRGSSSAGAIEQRVVALHDLLRAPFHSPRETT